MWKVHSLRGNVIQFKSCHLHKRGQNPAAFQIKKTPGLHTQHHPIQSHRIDSSSKAPIRKLQLAICGTSTTTYMNFPLSRRVRLWISLKMRVFTNRIKRMIPRTNLDSLSFTHPFPKEENKINSSNTARLASNPIRSYKISSPEHEPTPCKNTQTK